MKEVQGLKRTKVLLLLVLVLILATVATACGDQRPTINVYNYGDYNPEFLRNLKRIRH